MTLKEVYGTSTATFGSISPPAGFKWKIIRLNYVITAGTGTGTRQILMEILPYTPINSTVFLPILQSATSSGSVSAILSGVSGSTNVLYSDLSLSANDSIIDASTIVSGDTVSFYLLVDEVLND